MMEEYALRLNAMLEMSAKIDAAEWKELAMAASLPYMEDDNRQQIMATYDQSSYDIVEMLREQPDDEDAINRAKGELNG